MDEYSERCYQVLKMPSNDPETFWQQKRKADETEGRAVVLASWLRAPEESKKSLWKDKKWQYFPCGGFSTKVG